MPPLPASKQSNILRLLITDPERDVHYRPVFEYLQQAEVDVQTIYPGDKVKVNAIDLALTSDEFTTASALQIRSAKAQGIPTLHIVDGITEWRNTWENPRTESEDRGMPMFQPILSDKIACIGASQGRLFCSWGQADKVEITGLPRLDYLIPCNSQAEGAKEGQNSTLKLVIGTARTPGFTPDQVDKVRASLEDINDYLVTFSQSQSVSVVWRVGIPEILPDNHIGVSVNERNQPLSRALDGVSALITTPSTLALEAMAMQIPTCIVDYTNSPAYLHAGWRITSKDHIKGEIESMMPSRNFRRMAFQRYLLHDQLRIDSPSAPRVAKLIMDMIRISKLAKKQKSSICFPKFMTEECAYHSELSWDPFGLFPAHPIFARSMSDGIKAELGHLRLMLKQKDAENKSLREILNYSNVSAKYSKARIWLLQKIIG